MSDPKILNMKVFVGKDDQPIFYGYPDENVLFCTVDQQWVDKPSFLEHFHERDVLPEDMGDLIVNDPINDEDFHYLDEVGMVDPVLKQMYEKIAGIKEKIEGLEEQISQTPEQQEDTIEEEMKENIEPEPEKEEVPFDDKKDEGKSIEPFRKVITAVFNDPSTPLDQIIKGVTGLSSDHLDLIEKIRVYL